MFKRIFSLSLLAFYAINAHASIVVNNTRVIYSAEKQNVGVRLQNVGKNPSLVQVWLENSKGETNNLPFTLTPPISRVDGKMSQTIRIRAIGDTLPKDRESLFYFNLLDIPPKTSDGDTEHQLKSSVRSKFKFFYRPAKLPYPVTQAYEKVTFHLAGQTLTVKNPTPYYITYSYIGLLHDKQELADIDNADMIAPFSEQNYTVKKAVPQANQVEWFIINDYGGDYGNVSPLQRYSEIK